MNCDASMAWMRMPGQSWPGAAAAFLVMWFVMMVVMMAPALVPMLVTYRRSVRMSDADRLAAPTAVAGLAYFVVWGVVGVVVWPFGVALTAAAARLPALLRALPVAAAVVVLLAGGLQVTRWKMRQLARCREDPDCCRRLPGEVGVAWRHGLHLGMHCVRCCLPYTLVLLATGVMSLPVMAAVTAGITLERLAPGAERVARVVGAAMVVVGAVLLVKALR
jgi:predicted metal-binding membrane protein